MRGWNHGKSPKFPVSTLHGIRFWGNASQVQPGFTSSRITTVRVLGFRSFTKSLTHSISLNEAQRHRGNY